MFGSLLTTIFAQYSHIKKIKQMKKLFSEHALFFSRLLLANRPNKKFSKLAAEQVNNNAPSLSMK